MELFKTGGRKKDQMIRIAILNFFQTIQLEANSHLMMENVAQVVGRKVKYDTIRRHLDGLVKEGIVKKRVVEYNKKKAYLYKFVGLPDELALNEGVSSKD